MSNRFETFWRTFSAWPTLVHRVQARAVEEPERAIYTFLPDDPAESISLTYGELDRRARAVAAHLQSLNAAGQRVLLVYPPGLEFTIAFFGCLYAGAIAVPLPPPGSARNLARVEAIAQKAQAAIGLSTRLVYSLVKRRMTPDANLQQLHWLPTDELPPGLENEWQLPSITADTLAYLQFTSGSTGQPKGVQINYANLSHNAAVIAGTWNVTPASTHVLWMPTFHDFGLVAGMIHTIYSNTPLILLSPLSVMLHPISWLKAISRYRATISGGMNFGFELCVTNTTAAEREGLDLSNWQLAYSGGEMIYWETLERFTTTFAPYGFRPQALCPGYGLAEATLLVTALMKRKAALAGKTVDKSLLEQGRVKTASGDSTSSKRVVSCGQPLGGQTVLIVDPDSQAVCPPDRVGEVWVAGPSVAQGYWQDREKSEQLFGATLPGYSQKFLRTGDLGFQQEGELFITGRIKDLMIIRGRNLYPDDLEKTIAASHGALRPGSGAVFSIEGEGSEQLVAIHEVGRHSREYEETLWAIRRAVAETHEVKAHAVVLLKEGTIPKTSSGKIARSACRKAFLAGELEAVYEWRERSSEQKTKPVTATAFRQEKSKEEIMGWLAERLATQLGMTAQEVDVQQNFNYYGLDSGDVVQLIRELENWSAKRITPTVAWDYPTIERLAQWLAGESSKRPRVTTTRAVSHQNEPVAIVGLACRFPGADTTAEFATLLQEGRHVVMEIPADRWPVDAFYDPQPAPGKMYTRRGSFLQNVDQFDPFVFGISPREATAMDPQQRLLLEVAWEALESAGQAADKLSGSRTGVFVGISTNDYYQLQLRLNDPQRMDMYAGTGSALTIAANRLSYLLDLKGPSLAVDTACSSSLVAVHLACRSLQDGESDLAIAAGVNVILSPELSIIFCNQGVLSPDGRCKTFAADADGYGRGEGCGVVVLKRLADALSDGDRVLAIIRGTAVTQDGRSNGMTAPNGLAQQAVIGEALANAGLSAGALSYIEAHGTGTPLGDPIEVESLAAVLAQDTAVHPCFLGSVKTNIGHLEAAAGIAGLIKVVLSLQHQQIYPHPHLETLNPHISLQQTRLAIPTEPQPWPAAASSKIAGVSAFAFGGTNAHAIVEEAPAQTSSASSKSGHLLLLSAKTGPALEKMTAALAHHLQQNPHRHLADVAYTLQTGRTVFRHRRMLVCRNRHDAIALLHAPHGDAVVTHVGDQDPRKRPVTFLFPGQGAQTPHMARGLVETEPVLRQALDRCATILESYLEQPLLSLLYPDAPAAGTPLIHQTAFTQPVLFALEYALAQLWMAWVGQPAAMIGHSIGEYVAACLAGVFSLEDALMLVAARGQLMQQLPGGAMLAVALPSQEAKNYLHDNLSLATVNGPKRCVISGTTTAVDRLQQQLRQEGIGCRRLQTSHAFHSHMMDPILEAFREVVEKINLRPPQRPYISNLTGTWILPEEATNPDYYVQQLRQTVYFGRGLQEIMGQHPAQLLLEVGPGHSLTTLVRRHPERTATQIAAPTLPATTQTDDVTFTLTTLGKLWLQGIPIDWKQFHQDEKRMPVSLPPYPFERQRYWIDRATAPRPSPPEQSPQTAIEAWLYVPSWQRTLSTTGIDREQFGQTPRTWWIFVDPSGTGVEIGTQLQQAGQDVVYIQAGRQFGQQDKNHFTLNPDLAGEYEALVTALFTQECVPHRIVHLWSLGALPATAVEKFDGLAQTQANGFYSLLFLAQALEKQRLTTNLQIDVITNGVYGVTGQEELYPQKATILGPALVMPQEYPHVTCRCVDIILPDSPDAQKTAVLANQLVAELTTEPVDKVVAYRGIYRWHRTFTKAAWAQTGAGGVRLREAGTYLIIGGLGGLGLTVAKHLAKTKAANLVLLGRSTLPARNQWQKWLSTHDDDDPVAQKIRGVQSLEKHQANVLLVSADVADLNQMQAVMDQIGERFGSLNGVIHTAGTADITPIYHTQPEPAAAMLRAKVRGTAVLQRLLAGQKLDFLLLFSSVASIFGGFGLATYSAANAVLDTAAAHFTASYGIPTIVLNWDLWLKTGLFARALHRSPDQMQTLAPQKKHGLLPAEGIGGLQAILSRPFSFSQIVVSKRDVPYLATTTAADAAVATEVDAAIPSSSHARPDLATAFIAPRNEIEQLIAGIWQKLLGVDRVGIDDNFFELGGDSMIGTQVVNHLNQELARELSTVLLYENLTIRALAQVLQERTPPQEEPPDFETYKKQGNRRKQYLKQRLRQKQKRKRP